MTHRFQSRRVLLKLSGEALVGERQYGIDPERLAAVAREISAGARPSGTEIAIVVGAGNIFRGVAGSAQGHGPRHRRLHGHAGHRHQLHGPAGRAWKPSTSPPGCSRPSPCRRLPSPTSAGRAIRHLEKGRVVIFAAGTGNPFFTTDTAAALRALEIGADAF